MSQPSLFIGVVSHAGSAFAVNQGEQGLAAQLTGAVNDQSGNCSFAVNLDNDFDAVGVPLAGEVFRAGIAEEVRLEEKWNSFLGAPLGLRRKFRHLLRWLRVHSYRIRKANVSELKRLINIELSHLKLMQQGLDSRADWILVLEDDAGSGDAAELATGLLALMKAQPSPSFVNLSKSFPLSELGIEHMLSPLGSATWPGASGRSILTCEKPATNTVCAILYNREFLLDLVDELRTIPLEPVVPIDWRLNQALMALWDSGRIKSNECWFVEPAPVTQLSMHRED